MFCSQFRLPKVHSLYNSASFSHLGKLATIQPLPPRPQLAGSLNQPCVGASLVEAIGSKSSQQTARLSSPAVVAEGSDQQQGGFYNIVKIFSRFNASTQQSWSILYSTGPLQKLHAALALSNPAYKPPGFTITSFSEVSEGVLQVQFEFYSIYLPSQLLFNPSYIQHPIHYFPSSNV